MVWHSVVYACHVQYECIIALCSRNCERTYYCFAVSVATLSKCMHACMCVGTTTLKMTHSPSATAHLPTQQRTVSRLVQISTQPMEATRLVPWGTVDMEEQTAKLVNDNLNVCMQLMLALYYIAVPIPPPPHPRHTHTPWLFGVRAQRCVYSHGLS